MNHKITIPLLAIFMAFLQPNLLAESLNLLPKPVSLTETEQEFILSEKTVIASTADTDLQAAAKFLEKTLETPTGYDLKLAQKLNSENSINFIKSSTELPKEGYLLSVDKKKVTISANDYAGAFNAIQTLRQLTNPAIYSKSAVQKDSWKFAGVEIKDYPAFAWRGMHLDFSRHFFSKEYVFKHLDNLAMFKINQFHMHLTDDQGWRLEIKKYPKLTSVGAFRPYRERESFFEKGLIEDTGQKTYGGFFTQDDIREIIAYAAERNITILPEIDLPGHSGAIFRSYPEHRAGAAINVANPKTMEFVKDIIDEVIELFPSQYIHIGGDEVGMKGWLKNEECVALMKKLGTDDVHDLLSHFIHELSAHVKSRGRTAVVWHEAWAAGAPKDATIMVWGRKQGDALANAPNQGYDIIASTYHDLYFKGSVGLNDYLSPSEGSRPTLEQIHNFTPFQGTTPENASRVKGVQGCMWSEALSCEADVDYVAFPRAMAVAEIAWVKEKAKDDYKTFEKRLFNQYPKLEARKINMSVPSQISYELTGNKLKLTPAYKAAVVRYTTDGSKPSKNSPVYTEALTVKNGDIITAISFNQANYGYQPYQYTVGYPETTVKVLSKTRLAKNANIANVADGDTYSILQLKAKEKIVFEVQLSKAQTLKQVELMTGHPLPSRKGKAAKITYEVAKDQQNYQAFKAGTEATEITKIKVTITPNSKDKNPLIIRDLIIR